MIRFEKFAFKQVRLRRLTNDNETVDSECLLIKSRTDSHGLCWNKSRKIVCVIVRVCRTSSSTTVVHFIAVPAVEFQ